jgi:hypothetical protein
VALALVFSVSALGNLDIKESSVVLSGNPGTTNSSQYVNLSNSGSFALNNIVVNSTDLTGSSGTIPKSALTFFLSTVSLPATSSYVDAIIFSIPSAQKAGTYTGTISATHNSSHMDTAAVTATVLTSYGYSASADSPSIAKGLSGNINVTVTNTGNADISGLSWKVSNPFTSGSYMLSPSTTSGTLSVPYNSSASILVPFSPSSSQASGTYSGQMNLTFSNINKTVNLQLTVKDPTYSVSMPTVEYAESDRNKNVTKSVTITNDGDFALSGITLTTTAPNTWITGTVPTSLAKGASFTVTLKSSVPKNADSGSDKIGTLDFKSTQLNKSVDIRTNAKSMLEFDSVKVSIDDASWDSVNEGGTADDEARPGDMFAVKVKMENLFNDNDDETDLEIENVRITAVFHGAGEAGDDIDGDTEDFDIKAGDKSDEEEIDFDDDEIDWESNDGKLTMELIADGIDENGAKHLTRFNFSIDVERESSAEFIFTRFEVPSSVQCGSSFTIYADGRSIGKKSDDEVVLKIKNSNLGIDLREEFEMGAYDDEECDALEDDDEDCIEFEYRKVVTVPANIASGTYTIEAELFRDDGNKQTDEETDDITVSCSSSSSSSSGSSSSGSTSSGTSGTTTSGSTSSGTTSGTTTTTSTPTTTTGTTPSSTTSTVQVLYGGTQPSTTTSKGVVASSPTKIIDTTKKEGFRESKAYLALLSILSVLAIISIIVILVFAFSSPRH